MYYIIYDMIEIITAFSTLEQAKEYLLGIKVEPELYEIAQVIS